MEELKGHRDLNRRAAVVVVIYCGSRIAAVPLLACTPHPSPRMLHAQGIDWDGMDHEGRPLKPEPLRAVQLPCEPSDAEPPGMGGPAAAAAGGGEEPMMRSGGGEEEERMRGLYRGGGKGRHHTSAQDPICGGRAVH